MKHNYFTLAKEMAWSDFKLRYHGSFLGILWSFLRPLLTFGVLFLVFSVFIRFDIPNFALYLLLGIILWNFFAEATILSLNSLIQKTQLVQKIAFPRSVIVVSSTLTALIALFFNVIVFSIFFAFSDVELTWTVFLIFLFIILLYFIALGMGFLIAALYAKFKDIRNIWEVLVQIGFWLTPIIYTIEMVPERFGWFIYLNPITRVIQYSREAVLNGKVSNLDGIYALIVMTLVIFYIGYAVYRKRSPYFAEEL